MFRPGRSRTRSCQIGLRLSLPPRRSRAGIARRRFHGSNKPGEVVNVGEAVGSWCVIWLRVSVAKVGYLIRLQPVRDAHFIEVSVAGKR